MLIKVIKLFLISTFETISYEFFRSWSKHKVFSLFNYLGSYNHWIIKKTARLDWKTLLPIPNCCFSTFLTKLETSNCFTNDKVEKVITFKAGIRLTDRRTDRQKDRSWWIPRLSASWPALAPRPSSVIVSTSIGNAEARRTSRPSWGRGGGWRQRRPRRQEDPHFQVHFITLTKTANVNYCTGTVVLADFEIIPVDVTYIFGWMRPPVRWGDQLG